jgi:hypothetical protein
MKLLTRRSFLTASAGAFVGASGLSAYALGVEPGWRLGARRYDLTPPGWPVDLPLSIAVIADLHAGEPWISEQRVHDVVALANAMRPDVVVLLGDYVCTHKWVTRHLRPEAWADALKGLKAPLGVYSVLGNHDWWSAALPTEPPDGAQSVRRALIRAGAPALENDAVRILKDGKPFWIVGLGDQMVGRLGRGRWRGADDLEYALGRTRRDEPAILLAHEPWIFARVPRRVALTISGHTHGGQVSLPLIGSPHLKNALDRRYRYGHIVEDGRHLIVSAGLGTSIAPLRFGRPPEVVEIRLGGRPVALAPGVDPSSIGRSSPDRVRG